MTWLEQIIRTLFFQIDSVLFEFIETLYDLLITLSRTTILTHSDIRMFADRIQMLLGVFMLFKVSFSIITYVINPDEFTDKSKGFAKIGQNIIISLILLVISPYIFGWAYDLQAIILEDNAIPNLLFGTKDENSFIDSGGQRLAFSVMIPFFRPDTGLSELSSCYQLYDAQDNLKFNEDCKKQLEAVVDDDRNVGLDATIINNYVTGVENRNFGLTFRQNAVTFLTNNNRFVFSYKIILCTAAAVIVILLLITYALDIALRSVKLAFLQLISPIPIISYIDPKQGKDGMFKKWYTMCFSTYISLFVRLLALYFGFYLIDLVLNQGFSDVITGKRVNFGFFTSEIWLKLFMIIGILMFIKQLPKILEGFGIKLDGGGKFTLNPFKKIEEEAIGGKKILGAAGGIVSSTADRGARIYAAAGAKNKLKAAAGGLIGIPGGAIRGFRSGKGYTGGKEAQNSVNRRLREGRIKGRTPASTYLDYIGSRFGLDDATLEKDSRIQYINDQTYKNMERQAEENSRAETLEATRLEHDNAQRKETLQRIDNVQSKGDAVKKNAEEFLSKKADFGSVSYRDARDFFSAFSQKGKKLNSSIRFSDGTLLGAGTEINDSVLDNISSKLGLSNYNLDDVSSYGYSMFQYGKKLTDDIVLSDGTTISKGTKVDDSVISKIGNRINKDYTESVSINNNNVEMLKTLQKNNQLLDHDVIIGDTVIKASLDPVDPAMVYKAEAAARDYNDYATEQVQNMLESGIVGIIDPNKFGKDQAKFNRVRSEYVQAVQSANESIKAYNDSYSKSVVYLNDSTQYSALKGTIDNITGLNDDITDIRTDSAKVESEIVRHKQAAADAKNNVTGTMLDEKGKVIIDAATGKPKKYGLDEYKAINTPRSQKIEERKKQLSENRSTWQTMGSK